jgi:hypothetical protein
MDNIADILSHTSKQYGITASSPAHGQTKPLQRPSAPRRPTQQPTQPLPRKQQPERHTPPQTERPLHIKQVQSIPDGAKKITTPSSTSQEERALMIEALKQIQAGTTALIALLEGNNPQSPQMRNHSAGPRRLEGVFCGEDMIAEDGNHYPIPAQYASDHKLVEGDVIAITITANHQATLEQISLVERSRMVGSLDYDDEEGWIIHAAGTTYRMLSYTVEAHEGQIGDDVIFVVPRGGVSTWAAGEMIMKPTT